MSIVITGATGQLGGLVVSEVLQRGISPESVVAAGRNTERLRELASLGVRTGVVDYDEPESLDSALSGAEKVLLISGSEVGSRVDQHANVIEAAKRANARFIAYTSVLRGVDSSLPVAPEHKATERLLANSGLSYALLRHSWYVENYTAQIPTYLEAGVIAGAAGVGRISAATRADFAAADAAVIAGEGHEGAVYELGGDRPFTLSELAAEVSRATGKEIRYQDLPRDGYVSVLAEAGLPGPVAEMLADTDLEIAEGGLFTDSGDLSRLIGRPTTPLSDAVDAAVSSN